MGSRFWVALPHTLLFTPHLHPLTYSCVFLLANPSSAQAQLPEPPDTDIRSATILATHMPFFNDPVHLGAQLMGGVEVSGSESARSPAPWQLPHLSVC